jgi:predicted dehydrogenase
MTRVAVVGLGAISFEHLSKLRDMPRVDVVGLCDLSDTLAAAVGERFGIETVGTDYDRLLRETAPDAVHVLTPPQSHGDLAQRALEAGAHVLVEKPITPTFSEYERLRDLAAERGLLLCENYTYRFAPAVLRALQATRDGAIGDVVSVEVVYSGVMGAAYRNDDGHPVHFAHALPGGALHNFVTHPVAVALAFTGPVETVSVWRRRLDPHCASDDELRALLGGPRSCASIAVSGHAQPPAFLVRVLGTKATLEVDVLADAVHRRATTSTLVATARRGAEELAAAGTWTARTLTGRKDPFFAGLRTLLERFYRAVDGEGPPPLMPKEMDRVNRTVRDLFAANEVR